MAMLQRVVGLVVLLGILVQCQGGDAGEAEFSIYLLQDPSVTAVEAAKLDLAELVLLEPSAITIDDVVSYEWATHTMTLVSGTSAYLPGDPDVPVYGTPFVVVAQGDPRYLGALMSGMSSIILSLPSIMVTESLADGNPLTLRIECGYPGSDVTGCGVGGVDPRFDPVVRTALDAAGKLVEK